ncbi:MAG: TIGR01620 family protein [Celeribacter sp.]
MNPDHPSDPPRPQPVYIAIDDDPAGADPTPATAPPIADDGTPPGRAMQTIAVLAARRRSRIGGFFWSALGALIVFLLSVAAWDFVTSLLDRSPVLGLIASVLVGAVLLGLLLIAARELAAFARLSRLDHLQKQAVEVLTAADLSGARKLGDRLLTLYAGRPDLALARQRYSDRQGDVFDADAALRLAEDTLLAPIDAAARAEVEAAARQVATVTAVVPLALADVVVALTSNLRMIRRIAELYGGRAGTLGSWRLTRTVFTHLVATGAVAVGDDLIHSVAGGGLLSRLSRRFGEGVVNGALTARVGVAAMEVCRPLPFGPGRRPSVTGMVQRALTGLFSRPDRG